MKSEFFTFARRIGAVASLALLGTSALAAPKHGIAMYGEPALPPDFEHLPYANPDAPTGGKMVTANVGSFDSLNPYIQKGSVHWQLRYLTGDSLMGRSLDEPFSLYGVIAESIETDDERNWVEFVIRDGAKFNDGSLITPDDVIWTFETLGTIGHGRYRGFWAKVESLEATGPNSVRFVFNTDDKELALLAGMRPILKRAQWEGKDFADSELGEIPIVSGEYKITDYEAGRFISFTRDPDYWANDIPFKKGTGNLDEIRLEFFGDDTAAFEAFKVGEVNTQREFSVGKWESQYNFPRIENGEVVKVTLPHQRPSGMTGYVMNTRRDVFEDWRVRDAMLHVFNFEFINDAMTGGKQNRITSYWSNSPLAMKADAAAGRVAEFLDPFKDDLLPGTLEGYTLPVSDGTERNRAGIRAALGQLEAAGYTVQDGVLADANGEPFTFEILIKSGASEQAAIIDMFAQSLSRIGVTPTISSVDSAQYKERTDAYDFDMTYYRRSVSLSPGNEQYANFGSERADEAGGRNLMGVKSEAVDALIGRLLNSESQDDFRAAIAGLDRVLTAGRYVLPTYQWNISRIASNKELKFPDYIPIFGDWPGWQPDVWWSEE